MMRVEALSADALQCPPKTEAHRPEQIEILGGIGTIGIRPELGLARRIHQRLRHKQQFAGTARALDDAFQSQQRAIEAKHPEQLPQPARQQPRRPGEIIFTATANGALLGWSQAQEPVADRPERTGQSQISPKGEPGAVAVQAVRQPGKAAMGFKKSRVRIVGVKRIQGAHQAKGQNRQRQSRQAAVQQTRQRMPLPGFRGGVKRIIFPTQHRVAFRPADENFCEQQNPQGVARDVHGPDGPRLGRAKGPGAENQHRKYDQPAQIVADAIELNVRRPQREKRAGQRLDPRTPDGSRGLRPARRLNGVSHTPDWNPTGSVIKPEPLRKNQKRPDA